MIYTAKEMRALVDEWRENFTTPHQLCVIAKKIEDAVKQGSYSVDVILDKTRYPKIDIENIRQTLTGYGYIVILGEDRRYDEKCQHTYVSITINW